MLPADSRVRMSQIRDHVRLDSDIQYFDDKPAYILRTNWQTYTKTVLFDTFKK